MKRNTLPTGYLSSFCMSLYLVMNAGISLGEGVGLLAQEEEDEARRQLLLAVHDSLDQGGDLHTALAAVGGFPKYVTDMVEIGERTGKLDDTLRALSEYYDRREQLDRSIRGAVAYPALILVMTLFVLAVLLTRVLPIFNDVYHQLGGSLSGPAAWLLNLGEGIRRHGGLLLIVLGALVLLVILCATVPALKKGFTRRLLRGLAGRRLRDKTAAARFSAAMAMALASGLDSGEALALAGRLTDDPAAQKRVEQCRARVNAGAGLADAVAEAGLLPPLYCRLLKIGVRTGSADTVMGEIARRCEADVNQRIETVVGRVEPTLVIIMSVIVGLVLLAVMLPLVNIMSSI